MVAMTRRSKSKKKRLPAPTREQIEAAMRRGRSDAIEIARRLRPLFEVPSPDGRPLIRSANSLQQVEQPAESRSSSLTREQQVLVRHQFCPAAE